MWTDENMAIKPEEWTEIEKRTRAIIYPNGLRKALHVAREWGGVGSYFAAIVALLALTLTQWNAANKRLADEARFEEKTGQRLDKIEESLRTLRVSKECGNAD